MATITGTSAIKNNSQLTCTYSLTVTPGTQSVADNKTPINYSYYVLFDTNGLYFSGRSRPNAGTIKVVINGTTVASKTVPLTNGITDGTYIIAKTSGTVSVPHNADGTKTLSYSISMVTGTDQNNYDYVWNASSKSGSMTLTTIPRASTITSIEGTAELGQVQTVNIARNSTSFTHKVEYSFAGGDWATILDSSGNETGHGTSVKFAVQDTWASLIPNSPTGVVTVRVTTYNGNTQIGSPVTATKTLSVPASVKPTIDITSSIINNSVPSSWGVYVQGHSQVKATITAAGVSGSTIKSYSITGTGLNVATSTGTSTVLNTTGSHTYTGTVTDSRGRSNSDTFTINVVEYTPPSVSVKAVRCTSSGTESSNGTYLKVTVTYSYASVSSKNSIASKSVTCNGKSSTSFSSGVAFVLSANCAIGSTYELTATVKDALGEIATAKITIPTATRVMNVKANKKGIAFGTFATEDETVTMAWKTKIQNDLDVTGDISGENVSATSVETTGDITAGGDISGDNVSATNGVSCKTVNASGTVTSSGLSNTGSTNLTGYARLANDINTIGRYRLNSDWIGFYASADYAANNTSRKGYLSYSGSTFLIKNESNEYMAFHTKSGGALNVSYTDGIYPRSDAAVNCGASNVRWNTVYAKSGSINTSDRNYKKDITDVDEKYIQLFDKLRPVTFGFNYDTSDRTHVGFVSQDVKESMDEVGLTDLDFAGYCRDEKKIWNEDEFIFEPVLDDNGNPTYIYSLRYQEFIALNTKMIQLNKQKIAEQQKEIESLKSEVAELKTLVQELLNEKGL